MRCFIAICPEKKLREKIVKLQKEIKLQGMKLVCPENIHLTLLFLGEIDEEKLEEIKGKLSKVKFNKFRADISNVGFFPNEEYIRVIWLGVYSESLISLSKKIHKVLNIKFDFTPHVTIARVKKISPSNKKKLLNIREKYKNYNFGSLQVNNIRLMKSVLENRGPKYEVLYTKELD